MRHPLSRAVALALAALVAGPVFAQEAPQETATRQASDPVTLDQVVVSAQKRVTNLQETPISVSVLNDEELKDRSAISLGSLADGSIPSLRIAPFATRSSALNIGIRGIGASGDANQPARDQGVGVYVDGVFLGRAQGLGTALYDVERIEVLKGPQGTLFGRNTEGGAISIVTKAPTGEFGLRANVGVSNYDGYSSGMHLDLPRVGDVSFKIDAVQAHRGGTTDNPMRGQEDFNGYDKRGARLSALWQPSDSFEALYALDHSYDATTPYHAQYLGGGSARRGPLLSAGAQRDRRDAAIIGVPQEENVGKTDGHLLNLTWTLSDDLQLKSISSYRQLEQGQFDNGLNDAISSFAPNGEFGRYSLAKFYQHQYSQEFQLIGNTAQVEYVAGAFYYHETVGDNAQTPNTLRWNADGSAYTTINQPLDLGKVRIDRASKAKADSLGVFGQATWTPASIENLHLTAGGRWTKDDKEGRLHTLNGAASNLAFEGSWSRFDPMLNVAYDLGDDTMVYAKWSTGFKAGGANSRSISYRAFAPEEVEAIELGAKTQFWDDRARLNLALFSATVKDRQMDFFLPLAPGQTRTVSDTTNASTDGKSKGAELEFSIMPLDGLTLSVDYAYTKADPLSAPNPYVAGNPLVTVLPLYAPENAGSVGIDYLVPLGASALKFHLDGNWSDGYYTSEVEQTLTDSSFVVNARVALIDVPLGSSGATAEFSLWSRNLLDEEHLFYTSNTASLGTYGIFNDPRTFGLDVAIRF
ncbi:TonB-dependent receptor [Xanthomonas sp. NCPPB 2654]|uniref:TonB-dependent receptor n=1 Tax=unclassified Xanthomonas TaxID=2643310 RepID=UPI0021E09BCF|nr:MULTISPECIES: TonB-dependent receptor [unclassified Xanthomonas]MDL5365374.1 TonB-dependent receptor [Xanthomonas sp. NCPPB 2654]UYC20175.1 TonB-dependent receptor [Xanthomonas sp. CFBP 8443]